jgi:DNA-binding MarR family transcriptional regulator
MLDRTANLLGTLALAVTDRIEAVARETLDRAGETPAAVVVIGYGPGLSNDKLRRILGLSHPGAVRLVDRLVDDALVERRPGRTKRDVALHLTPRGERARLKLLKGRLAAVRSLIEPLTPGEQETLAALIHKALAAIGTCEMERYTLCRLCDDRVCLDCPLPTRKGAEA